MFSQSRFWLPGELEPKTLSSFDENELFLLKSVNKAWAQSVQNELDRREFAELKARCESSSLRRYFHHIVRNVAEVTDISGIEGLRFFDYLKLVMKSDGAVDPSIDLEYSGLTLAEFAGEQNKLIVQGILRDVSRFLDEFYVGWHREKIKYNNDYMQDAAKFFEACAGVGVEGKKYRDVYEAYLNIELKMYQLIAASIIGRGSNDRLLRVLLGDSYHAETASLLFPAVMPYRKELFLWLQENMKDCLFYKVLEHYLTKFPWNMGDVNFLKSVESLFEGLGLEVIEKSLALYIENASDKVAAKNKIKSLWELWFEVVYEKLRSGLPVPRVILSFIDICGKYDASCIREMVFFDSFFKKLPAEGQKRLLLQLKASEFYQDHAPLRFRDCYFFQETLFAWLLVAGEKAAPGRASDLIEAGNRLSMPLDNLRSQNVFLSEDALLLLNLLANIGRVKAESAEDVVRAILVALVKEKSSFIAVMRNIRGLTMNVDGKKMDVATFIFEYMVSILDSQDFQEVFKYNEQIFLLGLALTSESAKGALLANHGLLRRLSNNRFVEFACRGGPSVAKELLELNENKVINIRDPYFLDQLQDAAQAPELARELRQIEKENEKAIEQRAATATVDVLGSRRDLLIMVAKLAGLLLLLGVFVFAAATGVGILAGVAVATALTAAAVFGAVATGMGFSGILLMNIFNSPPTDRVLSSYFSPLRLFLDEADAKPPLEEAVVQDAVPQETAKPSSPIIEEVDENEQDAGIVPLLDDELSDTLRSSRGI